MIVSLCEFSLIVIVRPMLRQTDKCSQCNRKFISRYCINNQEFWWALSALPVHAGFDSNKMTPLKSSLALQCRYSILFVQSLWCCSGWLMDRQCWSNKYDYVFTICFMSVYVMFATISHVCISFVCYPWQNHMNVKTVYAFLQRVQYMTEPSTIVHQQSDDTAFQNALKPR